MAIYKLFPEQDATIYSLFPLMNTGIDEIIEATTTIFGEDINPQVSRFLVKFNDEEINEIINDNIQNSNFAVYFKTFTATVSGLGTSIQMELYPISGSWANGTGKYLDSPLNSTGVSWEWKQYSGSDRWSSSNFSSFVTASYQSSLPGGGNWYTASSNPNLQVFQSTSFGYRTDTDLSFNVTDIIHAWVSGTIINDGLIIKQSKENEFIDNSSRHTEFKYFSVDTNTIYPPQLEFRWDDYVYNTGSLNIIDTSDVIITLPNNTNEYYFDSIQTFKINTRPKYPTRTFQTSSIYTTNYYLPTSSYYAIKDLDTNEYVIDFDDTYTKISADSYGNYFKIYMNGLEPERYYKILIKTIINGTTLILDDNYYFKVING